MSKLISNGATSRSLRLVFALTLLATSLGLTFFPDKACAAWAERTVERYYSDATYSVLVGHCIDNGCTGTYYCEGRLTAFVTTTTRPC